MIRSIASFMTNFMIDMLKILTMDIQHPVAVGNAKDILKKHAIYITKTNNDCGVAYVLEELLRSLPTEAKGEIKTDTNDKALL